MKIVHIQVIPKLSGVQQISLDILKSINDSNIKKFIVCGELNNKDLDFISAFEQCGVKVIIIPSLKRNIGLHDFLCFYQLYKLFKHYKFDIVHTNSTKPGIIARIAAKFAGIKKIIHTVHGIAFHKHSSYINRLTYWLLENIATLFGHDNITVNKKYISYYPFVKSKMIYNGVDFSNLHPCKVNNDTTLHFAFLARLDEQKNPLEFIKAVRIVINSVNDKAKLKFTLAGDGELKIECEKLIRKLELQDIITMPGWIKNKDIFFNNIDVLCQPSKWEAFGLVFVEAAYYSIPSIAPAIEGIPEVILDEYSGKLYQGNEYDMAHCMISYINNPSSIITMGNNARKYTCEQFDKKRMIKEYFDIYQIKQNSH